MIIAAKLSNKKVQIQRNRFLFSILEATLHHVQNQYFMHYRYLD